jgi:hypothetical protein
MLKSLKGRPQALQGYFQRRSFTFCWFKAWGTFESITNVTLPRRLQRPFIDKVVGAGFDKPADVRSFTARVSETTENSPGLDIPRCNWLTLGLRARGRGEPEAFNGPC